MADYHDSAAVLMQNLQDAGCDQRLADAVLRYLHSDQTSCACCLLRQHKKTLLQHLHETERRIDSLDHLIYRLQDKKG